MNLIDKSKDNLKLAKKNVENNCHLNSIVSRIYYSVFQRMKNYLIEKNFDYKAFLVRNGYENERLFSHGTIQIAFKECFETNKIGKINLYAVGSINKLKSLYDARQSADYYEYSYFDRRQVEELYSFAESILEIFEGESA